MPAIRKQSATGIKKRNQSAILAEFENYNPGMSPKEAFVDQIDSITRGTKLTPYDAIYDWVRGGGVLVYNQDIKKYMTELGYNASKDPDFFDRYCRVMARDGLDLYMSIKDSQMKSAKPKPAPKKPATVPKKQVNRKPAPKKPTAKRRC